MSSDCKPWCGTTEHGTAWYERKGLFYCRERCVRAARRAAKATGQVFCDTPGCGREIPEGGEGHPEICPVCLACLKLHGETRRSPDALTEALALLREVKTIEVVPGDEQDPTTGAVSFCVFCDDPEGACDLRAGFPDSCVGGRIRAFLAPLSSQAPVTREVDHG